MFLVIVLFLILVFVGVGWYYSNQILIPKPYSLMPEFKILEINKETVTLPILDSKAQFADTRRLGKYNLLWEGGYGSLGDIIEESQEKVVRVFELCKGSLPSKGAPARLDSWYYRENPSKDHNIAYEELDLTGPIGMIKAWWIPNENDSKVAVMMLHGRRRGEILETLRIMPTLNTMGYPILAMSYRNHSGSDLSPDSYYHYGFTEWEDAMIGVDFLNKKGIEKIVIYAFSMGSVVALELLENLEEDKVIALVLDSPMVDPRSVVINSGQKVGLPGIVTRMALQVASWRSSINWQKLDKREVISQYDIPILLIAGTADSTVPIKIIDDFASNITAPLVYKRIKGVEHAEAWNNNSRLYEAWVREFLNKQANLRSPH